ncbi:hypothetical protein M378DRAFT_11248 [Amanita muscaria Koide BX008]|uniref:Uncharacterized protein n=1 Tax=Amanita muscaria (strain Koide BX008) TaxID=946122 RepID=A0A0C2WSJ7_AMAMK|nr:hypothetical protein M378DRAFT_11248 [Amanita muscaria Koide BX008]
MGAPPGVPVSLNLSALRNKEFEAIYLVVGLLIATIGTNAQGFSPGWIPGQQAATTAVLASPHASLPVESPSGLLNSALTSLQ